MTSYLRMKRRRLGTKVGTNKNNKKGASPCVVKPVTNLSETKTAPVSSSSQEPTQTCAQNVSQQSKTSPQPQTALSSQTTPNSIGLKIVSTVVDKGLAEIYQSTELKMGLCRRVEGLNFERFTTLVRCRDFLTDVNTFFRKGKPFEIYGMCYDGKEQVSTEEVCLYLVFANKEMADRFKSRLPLIWITETNNRIPTTKLLEESEKTALVVADKFWLTNCLTFSLYTLLLRLFAMDTKGVELTDNWIIDFGKVSQNTDATYVASVDPSVWEKVLNDLSSLKTDEFCGFDTEDIYTIHHNSGFVSVFGTHTEISWTLLMQNKHWHLMREKGFKMYPNAMNCYNANKKMG